MTNSTSNSDVWTFILDDGTSLWSWRRVSPAGEQIADSLFAFASLNGCVTDAQRAGFLNSPGKLRRLKASELSGTGEGYTSGLQGQERRRRKRKT